MAHTEDASTVLETFLHDVSNIPAEIAHLMEELQAKDSTIADHRAQIARRDNAIQKHVKANGAGAAIQHPQEDVLMRQTADHFDRAQALQEEKCALTNKATFLLDRFVKRLDIKIRDLQNEGAMPLDPQMPSMLHVSPGNLVDNPSSGMTTGANTPLHPLATASGSSTNMANAAMARMVNQNLQQRTTPLAPIAGMQPHVLLNGQRQRESSAGASSEGKRRRLNPSLGSLPVPSSGLARQSSLGPGTPKAGTPIVSRAGSADPRLKKPANKRIAPHQQNIRKKFGLKANKSLLRTGTKGTPSTTGEEESEGDASGSEDEDGMIVQNKDGALDDDEMEEDNKPYCICNSVSHGNMVACDNENCVKEWFHWECVGLTQEPVGKWLCPECEKLPKTKVKFAR